MTLELVEVVGLAEAARSWEVGERALPFPRRVVQGQRAPEGLLQPMSRPTGPGPRDETIPTEPTSTPARTWLAGCILHQHLPVGAPEAMVKINTPSRPCWIPVVP